MTARTTILIFGLIALSAAQAHADIIPPIGLAPGSQYQLIFATADEVEATNTNISFYNTFVTNEAALNTSLPTATWTAIASTHVVNVLSNAPNIMVGGSFLPVYNTQGILISSAGLYSGSLLAPVGYNQFDLPISNTFMWTGSTATGASSKPLGQDPTAVTTGLANQTNDRWMNAFTISDTDSQGLYALSSAIQLPAPEPSTLALLGSPLLLFGGWRVLQHRPSHWLCQC